MTRSDQIRALIAKGYDNQQIALRVGCLDAYVRVIRQRDRGVNHATAHKNRACEIVRSDPALAEKAKAAGRAAYCVARLEGLPWKEARQEYKRAQRRAWFKIAREAA